MPPQTPSDLGGRVFATSEMEDAAAEEGDAAVTTPPPPPTCPVCMEPWTCSGAHRICCIPCGHVYGRSCLEAWLHRSSHDTAKCPQCGEQFEHKLITNLFAPGNLWDGCCRLQELEARYKFIIDSRFDRLKTEMKEEIEKTHAELKESCRVNDEQVINQIKRSHNEEMATANAKMMLMKDHMRKMAEEENVTAMDLIEFMEHSFPLICNLRTGLDSQNTKVA